MLGAAGHAVAAFLFTPLEQHALQTHHVGERWLVLSFDLHCSAATCCRDHPETFEVPDINLDLPGMEMFNMPSPPGPGVGDDLFAVPEGELPAGGMDGGADALQPVNQEREAEASDKASLVSGQSLISALVPLHSSTATGTTGVLLVTVAGAQCKGRLPASCCLVAGWPQQCWRCAQAAAQAPRQAAHRQEGSCGRPG